MVYPNLTFERQIFTDKKPDSYEFVNDTINLDQQELFDKFVEKRMTLID